MCPGQVRVWYTYLSGTCKTQKIKKSQTVKKSLKKSLKSQILFFASRAARALFRQPRVKSETPEQGNGPRHAGMLRNRATCRKLSKKLDICTGYIRFECECIPDKTIDAFLHIRVECGWRPPEIELRPKPRARAFSAPTSVYRKKIDTQKVCLGVPRFLYWATFTNWWRVQI